MKQESGRSRKARPENANDEKRLAADKINHATMEFLARAESNAALSDSSELAPTPDAVTPPDVGVKETARIQSSKGDRSEIANSNLGQCDVAKMDAAEIDAAKTDTNKLDALQGAAVCLVILAHLWIDVILLTKTWFMSSAVLPITLAFPLSQNAMVGIWAVHTRRPGYVRFTIAFLSAIFSWYVINGVMSLETNEAATAAAVGVASESMIIAVAGILLRRFESKTNKRSYGLGTSMAWMTAIGVCLGVARNGPELFGWTPQVFKWEFFIAYPLLFSGVGLVAWGAFASVTAQAPIGQRVIFVTAVPLAIALGTPALANAVWVTVFVDRSQFLAMVVLTAMLVYVTVLPLRPLFRK